MLTDASHIDNRNNAHITACKTPTLFCDKIALFVPKGTPVPTTNYFVSSPACPVFRTQFTCNVLYLLHALGPDVFVHRRHGNFLQRHARAIILALRPTLGEGRDAQQQVRHLLEK